MSRGAQAPQTDQREADAARLAQMGYAQQLLRDMGGFSNFALSFSIISVLTGAVTLYGHGLRYGGPLGITAGWWLVALLTLPLAASLAQLASSFPTAGALYHWAALLGGPGWGFLTAWCNLIGQVAITAGIDYGLAEFVADLAGWHGDRPRILAVYGAVLLSHAALNHLGVRAVAKLNTVSAWYHIGGVLLLVGVLAAMAPLQPLAFLGVAVSAERPDAYGWGFALGLLQAAWTFTGYDASAHATEETVDPTRNAPWGIVLSVAVSALAGGLLLAVVTLAIGDLRAVSAANNPLLAILQGALGPRVGQAMLLVAMAAMWFCGLASVTSNSRMLFAFARDGGVPGHKRLAAVSPRWQSPHVAVWACALASWLLAFSAAAYSAMVALSTVALCVSYALPVALGWRARRSGQWRRFGPWDLGRWSGPVNLVALAWVAVLLVLFVLPPYQLAGHTFAGLCALLAVWWWLDVRHRFRPPVAALRSGQLDQ
jgi:amino acid transporter